MDYLLRCPAGFSLFSDHRNLDCIFDPRGRNPGVAQHSEACLLRWAMKLSSHNYVIEYITGEDNEWADLMSRWSAPVARRVCRVLMAPFTVLDTFIWPTMADIAASRRSHESTKPLACREDVKLRFSVYPSGVIWIPATNISLQLRILFVAHCGASGHRSQAVMLSAIQKHFS
jgi:hypothetical protein